MCAAESTRRGKGRASGRLGWCAPPWVPNPVLRFAVATALCSSSLLRRGVLVCMSGGALACAAVAQTPARPTDAQVDRFVSDLMAKMTLDEKIGQMEQAAGQPFMTTVAQRMR